MTIVFSGAMSHAPGMIAWPDAPPREERDDIFNGVSELRNAFEEADVERIILFTSEHWTNYFLDHMSSICVGRADGYPGPVEPWVDIPKARVPGAPDLAEAILDLAYESDMEPGFSYELALDHGTMIPLHFIAPAMSIPIVPIFFNTLANPQPIPRRCFQFGEVVGRVARQRPERIAMIATGGLSHDPGERNHGWCDDAFDREFLNHLANAENDRLAAYDLQRLKAAGAGTLEVLNWIALAGAMQDYSGEITAYHPVEKWSGGTGVMNFKVHDPGAGG